MKAAKSIFLSAVILLGCADNVSRYAPVVSKEAQQILSEISPDRNGSISYLIKSSSVSATITLNSSAIEAPALTIQSLAARHGYFIHSVPGNQNSLIFCHKIDKGRMLIKTITETGRLSISSRVSGWERDRDICPGNSSS